MTIACLSVAHNGKREPGAVFGKRIEATWSEWFTALVDEAASEKGVECIVIDKSLGETVNEVNRIWKARSSVADGNPVVAVEFHLDAATGEKFPNYSMVYAAAGSLPSRALAERFAEALTFDKLQWKPYRGPFAATPGVVLNPSGFTGRRLGFIHDTRCCANIVEVGPIDGPDDYWSTLNDSAVMRELAGRFADALAGYVSPVRGRPIRES